MNTIIFTLNLFELPDLAALSWLFILHPFSESQRIIIWNENISFHLHYVETPFPRYGKPLLTGSNNMIFNLII